MAASTLVILSSSPQSERHSSHLKQLDTVLLPSPASSRSLFSVSPLPPQSPASRRRFTTAADLLVAEALVQVSKDKQKTITTEQSALKEVTGTKGNRVQSFFPKYGVSKPSVQQRKYTAWNPAAAKLPLDHSSQPGASRRSREDSFGSDDNHEGVLKRHKSISAGELATIDHQSPTIIDSSATPPFVDGEDFIAGLRAKFGHNSGRTDCFGIDVDSLRQEPPVALRDDKRKKASKITPAVKPKTSKAKAPKQAAAPKVKGAALPKENKEKKEKRLKTITARATLLASVENTDLVEHFLLQEDGEADGLSDSELFHKVGSNPTGKPKLDKQKSNLHSPGSAIRSFREQAVAFGSCSQLVTGDTPSSFREEKRIATFSKSTSRIAQPRRSLWDEAACGSDDGTPSTLMVDLRSSPRLQSSQGPKTVAKIARRVSNPPLAPTKAPISAPAGPSKPNFEGYTDAQLMKEVANCGFKPMKNRKRLISVAEQCWTGKQRLRSESAEPNSARPKPAPKARGKSQQKAASVTKAPAQIPPIEEVTENESEEEAAEDMTTATAPSQAFVPDLAISTSCPHPHITRAVLAQLPSHDIAAPSWREKILLYDPVVVEEMTAWLNTEGLEKIGVDEEVALADVRSWAESRGICCVSSLTWKGRERRRL
ncbi:MAG: 5'-flap endonuclease [Vezdaea aestivalis]|nr:MAG: 5'-flap endonuclease [Vezdaea aestivalis]